MDIPRVADDRIGFIGKRLGRFLITAELGRGGMATVYRARDPQVGRDVALKVMHGFLAGRVEIEARFRREAGAVAAIRHPSILALYDFAPPAGEEPGYIVSELIDGPGLRQLVETSGGRLLPEVAALITIRVAEALGAAHAAGIVHRDVKPDNVLIDRAGGGARIVLTDFGVAHVAGLDTMTATGAVLGSPAYMSPEQARGDDIGPSSDVFSLGVLLYQLCTGHLPFVGKDPLTVITAILRGEYIRPGKLEARIGLECEQVIMRCLAREPSTRFPDGGAVAVALRGLLTTAGVSDEQPALGRYLTDPEAFAREISPGIARRALAEAEQARRRRQIPRALAGVGRALAYAPNDATAHDLLRRLGSRRRSLWIRAGLTGAAATIVAVSAMSVVHRTARTGDAIASAPTPDALRVAADAIPRLTKASPSGEAVVSPATAASGTSRPTPDDVAPVKAITPTHGEMVAQEIPLAQGRPQTAPPTTAQPRRGGGARKATSVGDRGTPSRATSGVVVASEGLAVREMASTIVERASGDPSPAALAAPEPVAPPETSSVILRASHGFCEPSLDDNPPSLRASYNNLGSGPHEIFCTLPQGGGKVHVATYDLHAGKRPSLIIVPGPDGRPTLGRPE